MIVVVGSYSSVEVQSVYPTAPGWLLSDKKLSIKALNICEREMKMLKFVTCHVTLL